MQNGVTVYLVDKPALSSGALLLRAAADYTGADTAAWGKKTLPHGKPYFPEAPQLFFSVSHSGRFWACAFSDAPLGLDLQIHKAASYARLAARYFREEEALWLAAQKNTPEAFYRLWTAKESYLKLQGSGFPAKLGTFCVLSPLPGGEVLSYLPAPSGYTMCLCTKESLPYIVKKRSF